MRTTIRKAIQDTLKFIEALSGEAAMDRAIEVYIDDYWGIDYRDVEDSKRPLFVERVYSQDKIYEGVNVDDLVYFDYKSKDGQTRTRVGVVLEVDWDYILIYDFNRGKPRRSNFRGIGFLTVLEPVA
jgi:hypothetical protein